MELLTVFNRYTSYFHDGDVFEVCQEKNKIILWLTSNQIPPEEMVDNLTLTNLSTLRGRLHLENVHNIFVNDVPTFEIKKYYDIGDIYHLDISDNVLNILITWKTEFRFPVVETDMMSYRIHAEKIFWENLPFVNDPTQRPLEDYQQFFKNGKISRITQIDGKIVIAIESAPVSDNFSDRDFPLTIRHTMLGELLINWPKNLSVDGRSCSSIEDLVGTAEIIDLNIGHHFFSLKIRWLHIENDVVRNPIMVIETEFGAIDMRSVYNY